MRDLLTSCFGTGVCYLRYACMRCASARDCVLLSHLNFFLIDRLLSPCQCQLLLAASKRCSIRQAWQAWPGSSISVCPNSKMSGEYRNHEIGPGTGTVESAKRPAPWRAFNPEIRLMRTRKRLAMAWRCATCCCMVVVEMVVESGREGSDGGGARKQIGGLRRAVAGPESRTEARVATRAQELPSQPEDARRPLQGTLQGVRRLR